MQECCPIAPGNGSKPSDWNVLITSFAKGKHYLCNKVINNKGVGRSVQLFRATCSKHQLKGKQFFNFNLALSKGL